MKRIEQKVEDTWCLEDMFESDDFWEEEFGRLQRMIFQYEDFSWGMDTEETFNQSSLKFDEKDLGQTQDSAKTYTSEEELSLDNAKANMNLEFSNDQLNQVSFTFYLEKDAKEWIQKEVDELNSLYGDVETTGLDNQTYQWSGEQNTVLQMVVFSKNDEKATVILSVASFEYSIGS